MPTGKKMHVPSYTYYGTATTILILLRVGKNIPAYGNSRI